MNQSTTHLVCRKYEGKKYELARKLKIIVVNHRWVEDCVKQGRCVSERPYMKHCGAVIGPLLLEIPVASKEVRSVFGEASASRSFSKNRVIDVESNDDGDDDWTQSSLLKRVVSSVKWVEDELELNALHNPGSRRGSGNEKAAASQRSALSAALGGRVEVYAINTISGVKATYLLAIAFLEIIRFSSNGGLLN